MSDVGLVLVVILVLVIIWRGPRTLPKIGQALGRGVKAAREQAKSISAESGVGSGVGSSDEAATTHASPASDRDPTPRP
jgi:Sec-independent protein translocase protein TatA